ncbi:hypothetical protein [Photorhabdus caribbeanensis]|nr:hypothetical protein [Photorhabdus caribbeanensis]
MVAGTAAFGIEIGGDVSKRPVISPCSSSLSHARYRFLIFTWRLTP